jgi:type IV pilus assembly protein PilC
MQFSYKALKDGKEIDGTIDGASKEAAVSALVHQGLHPMTVKPASTKGKGFTIGKPKVKLNDLVIFTRQLSTMISAGVPLARSMNTLAQDCESPPLKAAIESIVKDVEGGVALGDAFAKHPDVFSEVYVNMVKAGEEGGILDEILKRVSARK